MTDLPLRSSQRGCQASRLLPLPLRWTQLGQPGLGSEGRRGHSGVVRGPSAKGAIGMWSPCCCLFPHTAPPPPHTHECWCGWAPQRSAEGLGGLHNTLLFTHSSGGQSTRSACEQGWLFLRPLSLTGRWPSSCCISLHCPPCVSVS